MSDLIKLWNHRDVRALRAEIREGVVWLMATWPAFMLWGWRGSLMVAAILAYGKVIKDE